MTLNNSYLTLRVSVVLSFTVLVRVMTAIFVSDTFEWAVSYMLKHSYGFETAVLGRAASFYEINSCYILLNFN